MSAISNEQKFYNDLQWQHTIHLMKCHPALTTIVWVEGSYASAYFNSNCYECRKNKICLSELHIKILNSYQDHKKSEEDKIKKQG